MPSGAGTLFNAYKALRMIAEQRKQIANLFVMELFQTAHAVFQAFHSALNPTDTPLIEQDADEDHQGWNGNHGEKLPDGQRRVHRVLSSLVSHSL